MTTEQAFPSYEYDVNDRGMTLRDYFAAKAMAALVVVYRDDKTIVDEYSQRAYAIADAMMKAREL